MNAKTKTAALLVAVILASCNKDDDGPSLPEERTYGTSATICQVTSIDANLDLSQQASYHWSLDSTGCTLCSLTDTTSSKATFAAASAGIYKLKLKANDDGKEYICDININVPQPTTALSPYIAKVYDILPAPGQFTNEIPKYNSGDTQADIIAFCEQYLVGKEKGNLISLGGFGGYIVFGFDHTVVNISGRRDIRILGNAFYANANPNPNGGKGGSCEPGVVMVAYDRNKNGKPDADEWYEIAGSEYSNAATTHNYQITYYRPASETDDSDASGHVSILNYIRWKDNLGNSGYKVKNIYHKQSYYPGWIAADSITFKGTLLPGNAIEESGSGTYWVLYAFGFGYVDNASNTEDDSAIDIDWAVDATGKKVHLPGIDFVKVYTGVNQEAGWLGETSTEISGAIDLHLKNECVLTITK